MPLPLLTRVAQFRYRARLAFRYAKDTLCSSYGKIPADELRAEGLRVPVEMARCSVPDAVIAHYLDHRFDVLGSGWVTVRYGMHCLGLGGYRFEVSTPNEVSPDPARINWPNRAHAMRLRQLVDADYVPIDWHRDFKSGWRWKERSWYRFARTSPAPGADIKVPWELARMQHLPQMALAFGCRDSRWCGDNRIPFEFRNQVLDFLASNPPRFGVNWKSTMDVGIRAANWAMAHSLLLESGVVFDTRFSKAFATALREHGRHIVKNLEWHSGRRANHYLGNIAGLVYCAAALPADSETNGWLSFGVQELISEVAHQFLPDGGHFEGSTAYHRFAMEMILYPAALVLGLPPERLEALEAGRTTHIAARGDRLPGNGASLSDGARSPFPDWWWERLERACRFLSEMQAPNGRLAQIGDNDSGHFFKFSQVFEAMPAERARARFENLSDFEELQAGGEYWLEDHLDCRSLLSLADYLLGLQSPDESAGAMDAVAVAIGLSRGRARVGPQSKPDVETVLPRGAELALDEPRQTRAGRVRVFGRSGGGMLDQLKLSSFPEFGCHVYRSRRLYLLIRCWDRPQRVTAHLHNDQLSMELWLDGEPLVQDPGSYLYTPDANARNQYRSVLAHDTPWPTDGSEPADLSRGVFSLHDAVPCAAITVRPNVFYGRHEAHGVVTERTIRLLDDKIIVEDTPGREARDRWPLPAYSPGYGWKERVTE